MKSENKFLNFIDSVLNLCWFANNVIAILGFIILIVLFVGRDYMDASVEYPLRPAVDIPFFTDPMAAHVHPVADGVRNVTVQADHALIKFQVKNSATSAIWFSFFWITMEVLIISIIYNLRKVFGSIYEKAPFKQENIKRLKIIALCFLFFTPWMIFLSIVSHQVLAANIPGYHQQFQIFWRESLTGLWVGIAIYVTTYVFKIGLELQKENAEFI